MNPYICCVEVEKLVLGHLDGDKTETYFTASRQLPDGSADVVGVIHLVWETKKLPGADADAPCVLSVEGTFSTVSVATRCRYGGFGKYLVRSVEEFLLAEAAQTAAAAATSAAEATVAVATERVRCVSEALVELPPWYMRQGYTVVATGIPFPYPELLNGEYTVTGMRIQKVLGEDVKPL
jgi:hypothetical protein